jgi:hypothetical protein
MKSSISFNTAQYPPPINAAAAIYTSTGGSTNNNIVTSGTFTNNITIAS